MEQAEEAWGGSAEIDPEAAHAYSGLDGTAGKEAHEAEQPTSGAASSPSASNDGGPAVERYRWRPNLDSAFAWMMFAVVLVGGLGLIFFLCGVVFIFPLFEMAIVGFIMVVGAALTVVVYFCCCGITGNSVSDSSRSELRCTVHRGWPICTRLGGTRRYKYSDVESVLVVKGNSVELKMNDGNVVALCNRTPNFQYSNPRQRLGPRFGAPVGTLTQVAVS